MLKKICLLFGLLFLCICVSKVAKEKVPLRQPEQISVEEPDRVIIGGEDGAETLSEKAPREENANQPEAEERVEYEYPFTYTADDGREYTVMILRSYGTESMYDMFDFMKNPWENNLYMSLPDVFVFEQGNGKLQLKYLGPADWDGTITAELAREFMDVDSNVSLLSGYSSSEYCSKAIAFLCDEESIRKCFEENGICNIQDVVIINHRQGYIIAAVTESSAYYMTVPTISEKYGDFIFQQIYTKEEFKKIYGPRPAKVYVNGREVSFSTPVTLVGMPCGIGEKYTLEMDVLELAGMLGVCGAYDDATKTMTIGDIVMQMEETERIPTEEDDEYDEYIEDSTGFDVFVMDNERYRYGTALQYRNGRYLGSWSINKFLCKSLGYEIEVNLEDYSIHIFKASSALSE